PGAEQQLLNLAGGSGDISKKGKTLQLSDVPATFDLDEWSSHLVFLVMAIVLGVIVAMRPWRQLMNMAPPLREISDSQIMLTLAAAIVVIVIRESLALAFALVGLGGLRFRTFIKDPRDAALMFMLIALGMACGLGEVPLSLTITALLAIGLWILDAADHKKGAGAKRIGVRVDQPRAALEALRTAFPGIRVIEAPDNKVADHDGNLVLMEIDGAMAGMDAAGVLEVLRAKHVPGLRGVVLADEAPNRIRN
ncbi:MAG TPA: DUF4956 domain-containing protein, partial [Chloroflexota bacterium]|nr:DUF4956 domain-containing protein [Chloroflexota bacterium]